MLPAAEGDEDDGRSSAKFKENTFRLHGTVGRMAEVVTEGKTFRRLSRDARRLGEMIEGLQTGKHKDSLGSLLGLGVPHRQ